MSRRIRKSSIAASIRAAGVYFWSGPDFGCPDPHPDTDETALREGYITVTPLHFNLTHAVMLAKMKEWEWTV